MQQVAIATDASIDLPPALAAQLGIAVAPLGYDLAGLHTSTAQQSATDFYAVLRTGEPVIIEGVLADDFEAAIREAATRASDVVCVCQSVGSSFARVSAEVAVRRVQFDGKRVEIISPGRSTAGLGAMLIAAARLASGGASTDELVRALEDLSASADTYAVPANLDHLDKTGELSLLSSQSSVGRIDDGIPLFRVRGRISAAAATTDHAEAERELVGRVAKTAAGRPVIAVVAHAGAPTAAERLAAEARAALNVAELHVTDLGPSIGAVLGPGSYALGFCAVDPA